MRKKKVLALILSLTMIMSGGLSQIEVVRASELEAVDNIAGENAENIVAEEFEENVGEVISESQEKEENQLLPSGGEDKKDREEQNNAVQNDIESVDEGNVEAASETRSLTNEQEKDNEEVAINNEDSAKQKNMEVCGVEATSVKPVQVFAGNSISGATGISIGSTYNGSITNSNEKDFYRFTISSSGRVTFTSTAFINCVYYRIYDSTGNRLWSDSYSSNSSGQSNTNVTFDLTKGTYYLGVEQYYSDYIGNYSFKLAFSDAGESFSETGYGTNNTIATANSISVGTTYKGQIGYNDDKDFYKFSIGSSGRITLTSVAQITGVYYRIYDSTGERLWSDSYYANNSGQSSANVIFDLTKGTYYLGVERNNYTGNYSFGLSFASAGESFAETGYGTNNTIATANNISTGTTYKGQIGYNDDKDFYKFTASSSGKYTLTSTAAISGVYYRIYNASGGLLWGDSYWANNGGNISVNETIELTRGVYYLGVEKCNGTGNYSFKITTHSHNYSSEVSKATTYQNGKIYYKCSCGATKESTIYYPKTIKISATKYKYDGKVKKPSVTVKGSNKQTISPSNYTVKYANGRKNVGRYRVTITFKGNYSGSVTRYFAINPKATALSKVTAKSKGFTAKWKKQTKQVSGYQIQYSTSKKFSRKTTKTITKNSTTSKTYKGLKAKKKYYVRVRTYKTVFGTKYYSAWSTAKTVTTKK